MRTSHVVAVPSSLAVTTSDPFGLNAALPKAASPGSVNTWSSWPLVTLQTPAEPPLLAVTI